MNNLNGFVSNILPSQVVDREKYIDEIVPIIKEPSKSNIILLMGESAIGKTCLVDKLLDNKSLSQDILRVKTLPINQSEKNEEWEFLENIFKAVCKKYNNTSYSFKSYIYSLKNASVNKDMLHYVISTMYCDSDSSTVKRKFFNSFLFLSILWFFKLGRFDIQNLIDDNSIKAQRIKVQYIRNIFERRKVILAVDNIQNIDKQSLRELINIINETQDNIPQFIFEYTLTDSMSKSYCHQLGESFQTTSVETTIILIEKIESKYIVDVVSKHMLAPNKNWKFNIRLQEEYDKSNNGNIREMIDFGICFDESKEDFQTSEEYSLENILKLPDPAKQLLSLVICANNCIPKSFVGQIEKAIGLDIKFAMTKLSERLLIEENENDIAISHASLADVWFANSQFFSVFDNSSYSCLEELYLKNIEANPKPSDNLYDQSWISLINIYARHKPEKLISVFNYIDVDYKSLISKDNAWNYIKKIIEATHKKIEENYDLYINIIRYCFESELYAEGFQVVIDAEAIIKKDILILYHAMYLSALDRHSENIDYCKYMLAQSEHNSALYYNLKLISLSSYRSVHRLEECHLIHEELSNDKLFKKRTEYAFFLRLCEMYLERNKSLKSLSKSIKLFEKASNQIQAGKSLISYAYVLASQGKLRKAKKEIEKAEKYLLDKRMGCHMFLVNKAAIRLYCGDYSEEVWDILSNSEITAVVPFDKLAIIVNKLVWCIENKNSNRHNLLIKQALELLEQEPDRHIHGLVYYNIYYFLKSRNDENSTIYLEKAMEMAPYCKPVYARLNNMPTPETKFALKYNWHVCFLAYWTYDLI